jgi:hypothetical protein
MFNNLYRPLAILLCLAPAVRADGPAVGTVTAAGAVGDGWADDRDAIARACAVGGVVVFPKGVYRLSRSVEITGAEGLTLRGEPGAVIVYPSDDLTVTAAGTAVSDAQARAAIYLLDTRGVRVEGLCFRGGASSDITRNLGPAVYARRSEDVHVRDCRLEGGGSFFQQDPNPTDVGARLIDCTVLGFRNAVTLGSDAMVSGCRFEQPATTDYDRVDGVHGSSHAIYIFAGRSNVIVTGNTFKNIRTSGVKVSGSVRPVRGIAVTGNVFADCGNGVLFGADDRQEHSGITITGNLFRDCATNRQGWSDNAAVQIYGSRGVVIGSNQFDYTRDNLLTAGASSGILATPGESPLEDLTITGNSFTAGAGVTYPGLVLRAAIDVRYAGRGNAQGGGVTIAGNTIGGVALAGVAAAECVGLSINGNTFRGPVTAVDLVGNRLPLVTNNVLVATPTTSSNAQLRMASDSFPVVHSNIASGRLGGNPGRSWTVGVGGSPVDFPLLGGSVRAVASEGRPEVVFGYGAGWTDGDSVQLNGTTVATYRADKPKAGEFNTASGLIALLDAVKGFRAADYGAPWGIATTHIRVRTSTPQRYPDAFGLTTSTVNRTAGVVLANGGASSPMVCYARGELRGNGNSRTVVWSPLVAPGATVAITAENAAAAAALAPGWSVARDPNDEGVAAVVDHATGPPAALFRCSAR